MGSESKDTNTGVAKLKETQLLLRAALWFVLALMCYTIAFAPPTTPRILARSTTPHLMIMATLAALTTFAIVYSTFRIRQKPITFMTMLIMAAGTALSIGLLVYLMTLLSLMWFAFMGVFVIMFFYDLGKYFDSSNPKQP